MIKGITIAVGGQDIPLSLEEAKKLYSDLDALYGAKRTEYVPYYPWPYYVAPATRPWWQIPNYNGTITVTGASSTGAYGTTTASSVANGNQFQALL